MAEYIQEYIELEEIVLYNIQLNKKRRIIVKICWEG